MVGLLAVVLPFVALGGVSLLHAWPQGFTWDNLTLQNYVEVIARNHITRSAIGNSLMLGVATATIAILIGLVLAFVDLRGRFAGRKALDILSLIPLGLPGIVLAVAILQLWLRVPVPLYGTFAILLLAYVTRFLPLAVQSARTALSQVDQSLEEAARIGGVTRVQAIRRITIPLAGAGLVAGWILVFVPTIQELSASILLFTPETMTLAVAIFNFQDNGQLEAVSALGITMVVIIGAALSAVQLLKRRSLARTG
jgi:iron(III) transport system permease protein